MGGAHVQSTDADALEPATPSTASARFQAVVICRDASANPLRSVGGITLLERLLRQLSELETVESILLLKPIDLSLPTQSKRVRKGVVYQDTSGAQCGRCCVALALIFEIDSSSSHQIC